MNFKTQYASMGNHHRHHDNRRLPTTLIWGMNAQQTKRHIISKPVSVPITRHLKNMRPLSVNTITALTAISASSPYYWGAATHTYRVAQTDHRSVARHRGDKHKLHHRLRQYFNMPAR